MQFGALDDDDPVAVGLDEVRFVDIQFLHVGAGEVDALDHGHCGRLLDVHAEGCVVNGHRRSRHRHFAFLAGEHDRSAEVAATLAQSVGPDAFRGFGPQVHQQVLACGERDQAAGQLHVADVDCHEGRGRRRQGGGRRWGRGGGRQSVGRDRGGDASELNRPDCVC